MPNHWFGLTYIFWWLRPCTGDICKCKQLVLTLHNSFFDKLYFEPEFPLVGSSKTISTSREFRHTFNTATAKSRHFCWVSSKSFLNSGSLYNKWIKLCAGNSIRKFGHTIDFPKWNMYQHKQGRRSENASNSFLIFLRLRFHEIFINFIIQLIHFPICFIFELYLNTSKIYRAQFQYHVTLPSGLPQKVIWKYVKCVTLKKIPTVVL